MLRCLLLAVTILPASGGAVGAFTPLTEVWCARRDALVEKLSTQFQAAMVGQGVRDRDSVMELWADPAGEWTLVLSYAGGRSCVVSMGEAWDMVGPAAGG